MKFRQSNLQALANSLPYGHVRILNIDKKSKKNYFHTLCRHNQAAVLGMLGKTFVIGAGCCYAPSWLVSSLPVGIEGDAGGDDGGIGGGDPDVFV